MPYVVVGIFGSYADAEPAVRDLETAGIVGEQVEIISDLDEDTRTVNTQGERSTKAPEAHPGRLARLFGAGGALEKPPVRDESGTQPDYIGEQEFYATHVKQGGAVLVVRAAAQPVADRAAAILGDHGARTPGGKDGPVVREISSTGTPAQN